MKQKPVFWQNFNRHLIALAVLTIISIFFTYYFKNNFHPKRIVKSIEEKVQEKDKEVSDEINFLENAYLKNPDSIFNYLPRYKYTFEQKGYQFYIYDHDSMMFWSDNNIPEFKKPEFSNDSVINTGNGWYRILSQKKDSLMFVGCYLIKRNFSYQNEYLENSFHKSFELPQNIDFSNRKNLSYKIYDPGGSFLFSMNFSSDSPLTSNESLWLFVMYIFTLLLLVVVMYKLHYYIFKKTKKYHLFIFGFIADLLILRILIFYFKIPGVIYDSFLFSPFHYAYSDIIPSIGDLFLNVLFLLIAGFFIYYHVKFNLRNLKKSQFHKYFVVFTLFLHIYIFFKGIEFVFESLIIDSNTSLDLNDIFSLSGMSFFNFLIISMFVFSYIIISAKLTFFAYKYVKRLSGYLYSSSIIFVIVLLYCSLLSHCDLWYLVFVWLYIISFGFFYHRKIHQFNLGNIVIFILLFSIISTYSLHKYNVIKENESRKLLAVQLSSEQRDPLAEYLYQKEQDKIFKDTKIKDYLNKYGLPEFDETGFYEYFLRNYFTGYWKKYECQITICNAEDILIIQPQNVPVDCKMFFEDKVASDGIQTDSPGLYFVNYSPGENGYVAVLDFSSSDIEPVSLNMYVELFPKYVARDLGFPDLLVDKEINRNPDLVSYSYAKYQNGELYKRVGEYFYDITLSHHADPKNQFEFYDQNGFNHLYYKFDADKLLIISKKNKTILDILAPFSYLFLFYISILGLIFLTFIYPFSKISTKLSFRTRLQISISSVILFSFIVIGIFTLIYINNLNEQKNKDLLSEKTHSVLVEIQHKFADISYFDEDLTGALSELLSKFSNVFFTDINLFDLNGELISSSRPQIYDENLISRKIDPVAYKALAIEKSSLFIHTERIGKQEYLSAYIPFVNNMGEIIAYLNLPYFAKENDLNREISTFLVAYINIYVILIAMSVLIAILISNYISRPVKMIMTRIRQVKLGGKNETIDWNRKDEIGQLVVEYNRMIEELAKSAELLARSERESAWREMAKQVAHEIKNPLTPMKLSVQYLQKAWQNQSPDWDKRLDKFTQTMIEQIESLSAIASEFSDFAKMPVTKKENIDLVEVIQSSISLYKNYNYIQINLDYLNTEQYIVYADKEQLLRAFNNLLRNSVQAIDTKSDGMIDISLQKQFRDIVINIRDNGGGIPDEIAEKIFSPNFTTKSGGMGLGLAIVKNVIINSGGKISYVSMQGSGTTFMINLPAV